MAVTASELATTFSASEVFGVHALALESDEFALDVAFAESTETGICVFGRRLSCVAGNAIRLAFPLFVLLTTQVFAAARTREVLGVEFASKGGNACFGDRETTIVAFGGQEIGVASLAVGVRNAISGVFNEISTREGFVTSVADEVVGMIGSAECVGNWTNNLTATGVAWGAVPGDIPSVRCLFS